MSDASASAGRELTLLRHAVPATVTSVCQTLAAAGHQAVCVGGAVRDALLGRTAGDWDIATSARPDQVMALFRRTLPTGIAHGTVTVIAGQGEGRLHVEVTSFRGEGAYSDSRHPDEVHFGVPLADDLARRDFTINAIAFDPEEGQLVDPFDGRGDLERRLVRAVGDPAARFAEDGLRVMRAVRFVAALDFGLDPATRAALRPSLPALSRVARERVRVELEKLLAGPAAARGLVDAVSEGILAEILPELARPDRASARIAQAPAELVLRLALLLLEVDPVAADRALRRLTCANAERTRVVAWLRGLGVVRAAPTDAELRGALGAIGRAAAPAFASLLEHAGEPALAVVADRVRRILAAGDALAATELALGGGELMRVCGLPPGPAVGQLQRALLARVLVDPTLNQPARLEALARDLVESITRR